MDEQLLIAGAGYSGARLARRMHEAGFDVTVCNRAPDATPGITAVAADLDDPETLSASFARVLDRSRPLSVAYLVPPKDMDPETPGEEPRLAALLAALGMLPRRIVLASTSGVYGDHGGARVDETTPVNPETRRARNRVRLEQTLARWTDEHEVSAVTLRIAGIYGPGRLPLEAIREQQPVIDPAESGPGNRIHVDDLVSAFAAAITAGAPPALVNVADGDHCSSSAFTLAVAELTDLAAPPLISLAEAQRTYSPMRLSFINESRRLDARLLVESLGVTLRYPSHRSGILASLAETGWTSA